MPSIEIKVNFGAVSVEQMAQMGRFLGTMTRLEARPEETGTALLDAKQEEEAAPQEIAEPKEEPEPAKPKARPKKKAAEAPKEEQPKQEEPKAAPNDVPSKEEMVEICTKFVTARQENRDKYIEFVKGHGASSLQELSPEFYPELLALIKREQA